VPESRDVYLNPGDFCFAGPDTRIHTVLGSCVSITLWHPRLRIGGMCHYMLPARGRGATGVDGRYADDAVSLFLDNVSRHGTRPDDYQVKMFGGADQFMEPGDQTQGGGVAELNVQAGLTLLARHGFELSSRHLRGTGARRLIFELSTGDVWLRAADGDAA
jgi:chemotaxis protein CheD